MNKETTINIDRVSKLLNETKKIVEDQKRAEIEKGENFNIFSILRMERSENATHSAFIGELLMPNGSHLKGDIFLQLFFKTINYHTTQVAQNHGLGSNWRVQLEKSIGTCDLFNRTGGRVDIYLESNNTSICIENKIYAGDQEQQIERYCNHNSGKNTVYYLTLFGTEPESFSKGDLQQGNDFHVISYKDTILHWLENCQVHSKDTPILHESIRQYIILIKKLTGTMDRTHEMQLHQQILNNYVEADWIAKNVEKARLELCEQIRKAVIDGLKTNLSTNRFDILKGNAIGDKFAQIWIKPKDVVNPKHYFGIESFNGWGHYDGNLFIGITNFSRRNDALDPLQYRFDVAGAWFNIMQYGRFDEGETLINLRHSQKIQKLSTNQAFKEQFINYIVKKTLEYMDVQHTVLRQLLETGK